MEKDCVVCKHHDVCYRIAIGTDRWPAAIVDYMNSILARDYCFYNGKKMFEQKQEETKQ